MAEDKGQKKTDTALREEEVLKFWKDNSIFEQSLKKPAPNGEFVFYDGPPFATGLPHHGHLLGSTSKDLFGRYRTMRGYHVRRRWGWDTHGLPIESLVEKKLGLKNKKEILALGIEKFNEEARSLVLEYVGEWKRYIERLGRWVDFDNSYKTLDASYTESVWWALKEIHKKGNLYEGRKVLMYCPRDETVLAKAEIAMDNTYKDITEEAVYVKFRLRSPEQLNIQTPAFMVAWTTTPWTLPGNVALAVGPDIDYVYVRQGDETLIVAKERAAALGLAVDSVQTIKGAMLAGQLYEPLYEIEKVKAHDGKKWQVLTADFVTTTDGSGIVHTAVIYGEDDYALGLKEGLPMVPILNANATYNTDAPEFIRGEYIKKAEAKIKADLESRGLLLKKESYTHSYPHCHRCGTPLIYNAVSSWFINIQGIKEKLLAENEKVTWVPDHLKHGRFQKIVESAPDWTISRNRFWASPLPIWKDAQGGVTVIGSLDELKSLTKKSGNKYFVMRHGEAENNTLHILNSTNAHPVSLTEKGREQVLAADVKKLGITKIICSPILRTKETAELVADAIGYPKDAIEYDERLREADFGEYDGRSVEDFVRWVATKREWLTTAPPGGETLHDIKRRMGDALYAIEEKYKNETVLIVSHDKPLTMLFAAAQSLDDAHLDGPSLGTGMLIKNAEVLALPFVPVPHNRAYDLDYHLPYIDEIALEKDGVPLRRVPEVIDSWVEAGSMPFAEYHYPFENKEQFERRTPGDFISEYIAQTRTWFYYLHVLGVMLFDHRAFTNVVTTGTILAGDGEKMSKSKKNFTDPSALMDAYGSDALRYYLMSSVVMQAEDFNFRDDDLRDVHNKVVNILRNTLSFYTLYKSERVPAKEESRHVLDQWILSRLNQVIIESTAALDAFDTVRATRPMKQFVDDFSTWYVRRSRDRVKSDDEADKQAALNTLHVVFSDLSRVIAPVMPFIADEIHQAIRGDADPISVHLSDWPEPWSVNEELIKDMTEVRRVVTLALEARQKANIKVRQPLGSLKINAPALHNKPDLLALIADEINVKSVVVQEGIESISLDTTITPELREEGELRDLIRQVQELRKTAGLNPHDKVVL
ncbi:MAG: hypothetical protein RLZZ283_594, partial [Candidatus Parcubacteria bacterium]